MEKVNALEVRNHLGEILDRLNRTGEPILVYKGKQVRAVLVTLGEFEKRFLDVLAAEEKSKLLERLKSMRAKREGDHDSTTVLRLLRGYSG